MWKRVPAHGGTRVIGYIAMHHFSVVRLIDNLGFPFRGGL